jgi:phosphate transport system substrate-binding protein
MRLIPFTLAALAAALTFPVSAFARDQITLTGSSTVLPYANIVAEAFGQNTSFKTPVVEGGGTGAGIAKFCESPDEASADIATASRKIKTSELNTCRKNGVNGVMEVRIGYDGVVFASAISGPAFAFTPSNWFNALAAEVLVNGKLVPNPYQKWSDIDPALPAQDILAFIPGTKHGTREVFNLNVITKGCTVFKTDKAFKKRDGNADDCVTLRTDGKVVEIDGDYTETLSRMKANPQGVGVFGLSFYENNTDTLRVATFQGVAPSKETVASGKYHVSRPLYLYVKTQHIGVIPGLKEFVQFFVSDDMAGNTGPLSAYGLVVDPALAATQVKVSK